MNATLVKHNESGEIFQIVITEEVKPVILFTDFDNSNTNLLFKALQDIETDEYEPDLKKGELYYISVPDIDEFMEAEEQDLSVEVKLCDIKTKENAGENAEWIELWEK